MTEACPIQSPTDHERSAIVADAEIALLEKVCSVLDDSVEQATAALRATGMTDVPPLRELLTADLHQKLYCLLCGADPKTFSGGKAQTAVAIIRNAQQIARHYWGADIVTLPRSDRARD